MHVCVCAHVCVRACVLKFKPTINSYTSHSLYSHYRNTVCDMHASVNAKSPCIGNSVASKCFVTHMYIVLYVFIKLLIAACQQLVRDHYISVTRYKGWHRASMII